MTPTWEEQLAQVQMRYVPGMSKAEQLEILNTLVTPCPEQPWWKFWRSRHHWQDITACLNTFTYTTAARCCDCGLVRMGSWL